MSSFIIVFIVSITSFQLPFSQSFCCCSPYNFSFAEAKGLTFVACIECTPILYIVHYQYFIRKEPSEYWLALILDFDWSNPRESWMRCRVLPNFWWKVKVLSCGTKHRIVQMPRNKKNKTVSWKDSEDYRAQRSEKCWGLCKASHHLAPCSLPIGFIRGHAANKYEKYTCFVFLTTEACSAHGVNPPAK